MDSTLETIQQSATPVGVEASGTGSWTSRRRLLAAGGVAAASTAVLAACKGATPVAVPAPPTTSTTAVVGSPKEVAILNTALSLEAMAMNVYTTVLGGTLVQSTGNQDLLKLFQNQHMQHQDLLTRTIRGVGGSPVSTANATIMAQVIQPMLATLASEADVVNLAYTLEHLLSATCQADIGLFDHAALNTTIAQIGGIEARHVGLMAIASGKSAMGTADGAAQSTTDAVGPGTGV
ncbi:MAG: ferritin-like domain-containing protein [Acidimicrobiales bacterium]